MVLSTDPQAALQLIGRPGNGLIGRAAHNGLGGKHKGSLCHGAVYIQDCRQFFIVDPGPARSPARVIHRIGKYGKDGLPHVFDQAVGKNRIVRKYGTVVIGAGNILRGDNGQNTG